MNTFETYKNIARWDLTINRADYRKQVMSAFIGFGVLLVIHLMPQIFQLMIQGQKNMNLFSCLGTDVTFANLIAFLTLVVFVFKMSGIFSVLQTKQGRINEFMLPASNKQRFIWRTISVIVSTAVILLAGLVAYDLIQMLVHSLLFTGYPVRSFFAEYTSIFREISFFWMDRTITIEYAWLAFFIRLFFVSQFIYTTSTFILGGAIKYKKPLVWVLLFHFVFSVLLIFLMIFIVTSIPRESLEAFGEFWYNLFKEGGSLAWVQDYPQIFPAIGCVINFALTYIMWKYAYRLYCRARLVTRLNP